jgi:acyl-CoA thioesterase-2
MARYEWFMPIELLPLLTTQRQPNGRFVGRCIAGAGDRVYGGQVLAQALHAAGCTLGDEIRTPSALQAHFVNPGHVAHPVQYSVRTLKKSHRFVIRQVEATQFGETLVVATTTFHADEPSDEHGAVPRGTVPPELCAPISLADLGGPSPAFGPVVARDPGGDTRHSAPPALQLWLRPRGDLTDDPLIHACALTWLSDLTLTRTVDLPRQHLDGLRLRASLNHAVWFHRRLDLRDWLLADQRSDSYAGARGIASARYFDRSGRLQASATQECLIRRSPPTDSSRPELSQETPGAVAHPDRHGDRGHAGP